MSLAYRPKAILRPLVVREGYAKVAKSNSWKLQNVSLMRYNNVHLNISIIKLLLLSNKLKFQTLTWNFKLRMLFFLLWKVTPNKTWLWLKLMMFGLLHVVILVLSWINLTIIKKLCWFLLQIVLKNFWVVLKWRIFKFLVIQSGNGMVLPPFNWLIIFL